MLGPDLCYWVIYSFLSLPHYVLFTVLNAPNRFDAWFMSALGP